MVFKALYRKYRPRTFAEIAGQENITRTLMNQVKSGRVAHAYLFCGARGTGKTSAAKVLARAVNCRQNAPDVKEKLGEPCGVCDMCTMDEASVDIIEMDAASNTGVDDIRDLKEKVMYMPLGGAYKVYIIDEAHMLSSSAFNALLKTLEEPPEHMVFVLATTEPQKLPATIISRCQRYDFKRLPENLIVERLKEILKNENAEAEDEALLTTAKAAQGGLRDAISILDQCLGFSGGVITDSEVREVLGAANVAVIEEIADAITAGDAAAALGIIEEMYKHGKDMAVFLQDILLCFRDRMIQEAESGKSFAMRAVYELSLAQNDIKYSPMPRVTLEAAVVRLCFAEDKPSENSEVRKKPPEKKAETSGPQIKKTEHVENKKKPESAAKPEINKTTDVKEKPQDEKAEHKASAKEVFDRLCGILKQDYKAVYHLMRFGKAVSFIDDVLEVAFNQSEALLIDGLKESYFREVSEALKKAAGKPATIKYSMGKANDEPEMPESEIIKQAERIFNLKVEIED